MRCLAVCDRIFKTISILSSANGLSLLGILCGNCGRNLTGMQGAIE